MNIQFYDDYLSISEISDFSPDRIFDCGQCFRWTKNSDNSYNGIAGNHATKLKIVNDSILLNSTKEDFLNYWYAYFDLENDYEYIRRSLSINDFMSRACEYGKGIRILQQEPWEALCSFIISQCNNITRIKGIIERLCNCFGDRIVFDKKVLYTFPAPERLAAAKADDLNFLRCGYRTEYITNAARAVCSGILDLDLLKAADSKEAFNTLLSLKGVGSKVANCVMLFGLNKTEAFPIDTWMKKALNMYFERDFDPSVFGKYAGIAQQYIFYYMRWGKGIL